jgi:hypothetical protein
VTRLTEADLVSRAKDGHRVRYFAGANWAKVEPGDVGIAQGLVEQARRDADTLGVQDIANA